MKTIVIVVIALLVVVLALAVSCPDQDSFHRYLKKASAREKGNVFEEATDAVLGAQMRLTADYRDHTLWATVDARRGTEHRRFIGVFGIWLELDEG